MESNISKLSDMRNTNFSRIFANDLTFKSCEIWYKIKPEKNYQNYTRTGCFNNLVLHEDVKNFIKLLLILFVNKEISEISL